MPELRDVASDQQVSGLRAKLVFDRDTASRLGITPSAIDNTLYDAYGQRQVSTMFTQLNQYHVVLEVKPGFQKNPLDLRDLYIRIGAAGHTGGAGMVSGGSTATAGFGPSSASVAAATSSATASSGRPAAIASSSAFGGGPSPSSQVFPQRRPGAAERVHAPGDDDGPDHGQSSGAVPGGDAFVQSGAGRVAGRRRERRESE